MASDIDKAVREEAYAELMLARAAKALSDGARAFAGAWTVTPSLMHELRMCLDAVDKAAVESIAAHAALKEPARNASDQRAIDFAALIIVGGSNAEWTIDGDAVIVRDDAGWVRGRFRLDTPVDDKVLTQLKLLANARAAAQIARET